MDNNEKYVKKQFYNSMSRGLKSTQIFVAIILIAFFGLIGYMILF